MITVDARDHDAPGKRGTAGMFLAIVQDGKTVLSTEDLRYTLAPPADDSWRTSRDTTGLTAPDTTNVHPLHRGDATGDVWLSVAGHIERLVPRDVQAAQPIKATHRKVGPRDVYMVMGAPKTLDGRISRQGTGRIVGPVDRDGLNRCASSARRRPAPKWSCRWKSTKPRSWCSHLRWRTAGQQPCAGTAHRALAQRSADVSRPRTEASVQEIALDGEWEFELKPTMDNRYGDFRLPATEQDDRPRSTHLPPCRRRRRRDRLAGAGLRRQPLGARDATASGRSSGCWDRCRPMRMRLRSMPHCRSSPM